MYNFAYLKQVGMYNIVISNYEEREKEIMQENAILRQIIFDSYESIIEKIRFTNNHLPSDEFVRLYPTQVSQSVFHLPVTMMRGAVLKGIEDGLQMVSNNSNLNEEIRNELDHLREDISFCVFNADEKDLIIAKYIEADQNQGKLNDLLEL
jgi:hypothetical protein